MKKQIAPLFFCSKKSGIRRAITILLRSLAFLQQKEGQHTGGIRDLQHEKALLQQKQHLFAPNTDLFQQDAVSSLLRQCCYEEGMSAGLWTLQEQHLHCIAGEPLISSPLHNDDSLWRTYFSPQTIVPFLPHTIPFSFAWLPLQTDQRAILVLSYQKTRHHFGTSERAMLQQFALFFAEQWSLHQTFQNLREQRTTTHEQLQELTKSLLEIQHLLQAGAQRENPALSAALASLSPQPSQVEQQILDILEAVWKG